MQKLLILSVLLIGAFVGTLFGWTQLGSVQATFNRSGPVHLVVFNVLQHLVTISPLHPYHRQQTQTVTTIRLPHQKVGQKHLMKFKIAMIKMNHVFLHVHEEQRCVSKCANQQVNKDQLTKNHKVIRNKNLISHPSNAERSTS